MVALLDLLLVQKLPTSSRAMERTRAVIRCPKRPNPLRKPVPKKGRNQLSVHVHAHVQQRKKEERTPFMLLMYRAPDDNAGVSFYSEVDKNVSIAVLRWLRARALARSRGVLLLKVIIGVFRCWCLDASSICDEYSNVASLPRGNGHEMPRAATGTLSTAVFFSPVRRGY